MYFIFRKTKIKCLRMIGMLVFVSCEKIINGIFSDYNENSEMTIVGEGRPKVMKSVISQYFYLYLSYF